MVVFWRAGFAEWRIASGFYPWRLVPSAFRRLDMTEKGGRIETAPGCARYYFFGGQTIARFVDILVQPTAKAGKFSPTNFIRKVSRRGVGFDQLCRVETADRVGWEVAEHADRPMDVLKYAVTRRHGPYA